MTPVTHEAEFDFGPTAYVLPQITQRTTGLTYRQGTINLNRDLYRCDRCDINWPLGRIKT